MYGLLCIVSKNPDNLNLFGEGTSSYYMLADTADMLAMMFGHLDIIQPSYSMRIDPYKPAILADLSELV